MKCSPAIIFGFAATVAATAQVFSKVPDCALNCVETLLSEHTPCSTDDASCICSYGQKLQENGVDCVVNACGVQKATDDVLPCFLELCSGSGAHDDAHHDDAKPPVAGQTPGGQAPGGGEINDDEATEGGGEVPVDEEEDEEEDEGDEGEGDEDVGNDDEEIDENEGAGAEGAPEDDPSVTETPDESPAAEAMPASTYVTAGASRAASIAGPVAGIAALACLATF